MPEFRIPLKCNNCNKLGWDYQVWNGQQFITDHITPCCDQWTLEIQGKPQQYIELKDKERAKIFEWDIVKWAGHTWVIRYIEGKYGLARNLNDDFVHSRDIGIQCYYKTVEIIGNIIENPELMEKE